MAARYSASPSSSWCGDEPLGTGRQRILIVGATGTIGGPVAALLQKAHEVVKIARTGGDIRMDALSVDSIGAMYAQAGPFDALVVLMGRGVVGTIGTLSEQDFINAFVLKTLAQINLVRLGLRTVRPGGSFTLTGGFLSREPIPNFSAVAMANGAIEAFCRACALDLENGVRINCVSPVFVIESLRDRDTSSRNLVTQSAADTARAYQFAVEGDFTGKDIDPRLVAGSH
jgi:NAD(P)-dependent dehydrogenase (short-subunit alcohol dehydrogenase family)